VEKEIKEIMRELGVDTENMKSIGGVGKEVNLTIVRLQNRTKKENNGRKKRSERKKH